MSSEPPLSDAPEAADLLVIEAEIVPLAVSDTECHDRRGRTIVALLRGVLARRTESELPSPPGSDLVSADFDVPCSRRLSGQQCPDRVGGLGRTGTPDRTPGTTSESEGGESRERWVTKQQLAEHLEVTARWIEYQQRLGLPYLRMGGMNRYRVSDVEAWLRGRHIAADRGEDR